MAGVLVGAVSWLSACASGPPKSPAQGGAAWARLTTPHFTLYTDAPADEARKVAGAFEEIYGALEDVGLPGPHAPAGPVEVAFFHDREVFRGLVPDAYYDNLLPKNDFRPVGPDAYFRPLHGRESHDPDRKPMLALYATGLQFDQRVPTRLSSALRHQLTHRLVAHDLPAAPTWLHEGLASFNETITLKSEGQMKVGEAPWWFPFYDDSTVVLNRSFGQAEVKFSRADLPSAAALVAADHEALFRRDASPEAIKAKMLVKTGSWTLVRTLQLGAPPFRAAFAQYLAALKRGDEPRAAWAAALRGNGITPERLEAEYRATSDRWVSDHDTRAYAPRRPSQAQVRPMSEAEVHVLWARVAPWHGDHLTRVGAELDAAVNADPSHAPAYSLRGEWRTVARGQPADALADLRKGASLAPGDLRASYALARYLDFYRRQNPAAKAEVEGELRPLLESLRQRATSAPAWNFLALVDAREGQPERALASARKAVAADPSCFECYNTIALVLHRLGRLDEAVAAQRTGVQLMPEGVAEPGMVDQLVALKRDLAARAAPGAPTPAAPANATPSEPPPAAPTPTPPSDRAR